MSIPKYDGTSDPQENITTYTTAVKGNDLAYHEINLPYSFIKAQAGARKVQSRKADIFRISHGESELLREFVIRLQQERMSLLAVPDEWVAEAFTKGLNPLSSDSSKKLKGSLLEFQATTWVNVHNLYKSKTIIEDDQLGSSRADGRGNKGFQSWDRFAYDRRADHGRNNRSLYEKEASGSRDSTYPKLFDYNFNISLIELVSVMRNIKKTRFPQPIRLDPIQRDPNLWYELHRFHNHRTGDCRHLREEVATLLKNGHLSEFLSDRAKNNYGKNRDVVEPSKSVAGSPHMTINMIFDGDEVNGVTFSAAKKTKIMVTHGKRIQEVSEDDITFTEEDADGILLSHNDALLLAGFNLASATTRGEILLPTHAEGVTKTTMFEVVDDDMGYNVILGRPWIHEIKVVPSTYHQLLTFPIPEGIKHIRGDQTPVREINVAIVSNSKGKETSK
ncbi:PREDICTED: uncharacterized protein LOC109234757 [Nicotiana attenuata]|uniref:uncharacterized protein LOC109234757 n=1 Tax=Nicotiana attenuata TaxID=49451 RepID=UPI000905C5DF|nr:PREDICTED: uncharacterized protein LOC109234757 [Nicotiana attenuata]